MRILIYSLVVEPEIVDDDLFDLLWVGCLESEVKQARFLGQEPLSQLIVATVSQTADEMRDVVIRAMQICFCNCASFQFSFTGESYEFAFICQAMFM